MREGNDKRQDMSPFGREFLKFLGELRMREELVQNCG